MTSPGHHPFRNDAQRETPAPLGRIVLHRQPPAPRFGKGLRAAVAAAAGMAALGFAAIPLRNADTVAPAQNAVQTKAPTLPLSPPDWTGRVDYRALDSRIRAMMTLPEMTGLAVAVVEDGRLSFVQGYGWTSMENRQKVTENTVFRWASLSKGVAGTLTALMAAEGSLSLGDPVAGYTTSLRLPGGAESQVSLADLLSQRTGLVKNAYDERLEAGEEPTALRRALGSLPQYCPPVTCHSYQNIAFDAISEVIGQAGAKPYGVLAVEKLFVPLGMKHASVGLDGLLQAKSWARPHREGRTLPVLEYYFRVPAAAGVNSDILDLARWMQAQMGAAPDVLSSALRATVQQPRIDTPRPYGRSPLGRALSDPAYGLGMRSFTYAGVRMIGHSGAVSGYRSSMMFDPASKTGIALLWNSDSGKPFRLQPELFDMYFRRPYQDWLQLELPPSAADEDPGAIADNGVAPVVR